MDDDLKKWLDKHPARYVCHAGLLETYQMLFNCDGCPSDEYAYTSKKTLKKIIKVIRGEAESW